MSETPFCLLASGTQTSTNLCDRSTSMAQLVRGCPRNIPKQTICYSSGNNRKPLPAWSYCWGVECKCFLTRRAFGLVNCSLGRPWHNKLPVTRTRFSLPVKLTTAHGILDAWRRSTLPWRCQHEQTHACQEHTNKHGLLRQINLDGTPCSLLPKEHPQANHLLLLCFLTKRALGLVSGMQLLHFGTSHLIRLPPFSRSSKGPLKFAPCQHGAATVFPNKVEEALNLPLETTFRKNRRAQGTTYTLGFFLLPMHILVSTNQSHIPGDMFTIPS